MLSISWLFLLGMPVFLAVSCSDERGRADVGTDGSVINIATYNLWCAHSRNKHLDKDSETEAQRFWKPSSSAVAEIVREMDCDIFAFQEIGDSIFGKSGFDLSLRKLMDDDYEWKIWSNVDGSPVTSSSGRLSYSPGICYRKSILTCLDGGVFWLGGNPVKPEFLRTDTFDPEYGDPRRACVWARMRHKKSRKLFYFLSAHLDNRSFSGISYPVVNETNCANLMAHTDAFIVPEGVPSIIAGDMNTGVNVTTGESHVGYSILMDSDGRRHKWQDAYSLAEKSGVLSQTARQNPATTNSSKGDQVGTTRIDHVLVEGFEVLNYDINQNKYKTDNGAEHYPSDHFPVIVTLKF